MKLIYNFMDQMRMAARFIRIIFIFWVSLLASCWMVGPDYKEPQKRIAKHWVNPGATVHEKPIDNAFWWKQFHDPTLSCLINLGYRNNYNIQLAATKVLQSRAMLAQSVGKLYPQQQNFLANLTYQRIGGQEFEFVLPSEFTTAMVGLSANWELDFWGKYRRKILSSDATFLSSYAAYDSALVSLTSDIAIVYINIRTYEELIKVIQTNIQIQTTSYKIALARYTAGETNQLDVDFAKTELYKTKAALPTVKQELQRSKDLLGVLLGLPPDEVNPLIAKSYGIPQAPRDVVVGIPCDSIMHRPDVYQARLQAVSQLQAIGAVKGILFPALSLGGSFGFSSNDIAGTSLGDLFNWANRFALAGPSLVWPIFNYGQLTNMVRQQDAIFQEALLNYLQVVLQAQQETQDAITDFIETKQAVANYKVANGSAVKTTEISTIRYKEGESDFTSVLIAQNIQLSVQQSLTQAKGNVPKALVAVYRSIGGGWQIRGSNDIVANEIKQQMARRTWWGDLLKQENHIPPRTEGERLKELFIPNW